MCSSPARAKLADFSKLQRWNLRFVNFCGFTGKPLNFFRYT